MISRLAITKKALQLVERLEQKHGPLMFYQAGGCCEGTQPQCFEKGSFYPRMNDVLIGHIKDYEFWVDRNLFEYWQHAHFTLDVLEGFGPGGFSLESPLGKTFKVHYRLFTEQELKDLSPIIRNS
ncbi:MULTISPECIES: DUF779 domain-containing protein [Sphingobacterium]|uniref:DUF779 domain-containing protein n=1 Tax=Sphingobacterium TaxID=28453 RepID=UPI0013DA13B2|nr:MULTISPECIES: DUF779 domain-containing protein [unclassified Sphingobacterium]